MEALKNKAAAAKRQKRVEEQAMRLRNLRNEHTPDEITLGDDDSHTLQVPHCDDETGDDPVNCMLPPGKETTGSMLTAGANVADIYQSTRESRAGHAGAHRNAQDNRRNPSSVIDSSEASSSNTRNSQYAVPPAMPNLSQNVGHGPVGVGGASDVGAGHADANELRMRLDAMRHQNAQLRDQNAQLRDRSALLRNSGYVHCSDGMMSSDEWQTHSTGSMDAGNEHMCNGDFRHTSGGTYACRSVGHVNCSDGMMSSSGKQRHNGGSMHNFRGSMDDGTGHVCRSSGVAHHMCNGVGYNMWDGVGHRCCGVGSNSCAPGAGQHVGGWVHGGSLGAMGGGGHMMNAYEQPLATHNQLAQLQQFVQQPRQLALPPRPAPVPAHIVAMRRTYISLLAGQSMNPTPQMQMQIAQLKYDLDLELEQHGTQHGW